MARRARRPKKRAPDAGLRVADYQYPGEKSAYWQGVILFLLPFLVVGGFLLYEVSRSGSRYAPIAVGLWLYPVLCVLVVNWLAVRPRGQRLKRAGMRSRVTPNMHPELKQILSQQAKLLGMQEPDMYILDDDAAYIYSMPGKAGAIVASEPLLAALKSEETGAMVAQEMGHLKSHHVRMDLAITYIRHANLVWKILLFPVLLLSLLLRGWAELTQFTADRVALLVTGRTSVVNAALVKSAVAADKQAEIGSEELEAYLEGGADISMDAEQMERHLRIGNFLTTQKGLRERIEQTGEFLKTHQGQAAMQSMAEIRGRL